MQYVAVTIDACQLDCFLNPNDPNYYQELRKILRGYSLYTKFIDTSTDLENYSEPLSQIISTSIQTNFD